MNAALRPGDLVVSTRSVKLWERPGPGPLVRGVDVALLGSTFIVVCLADVDGWHEALIIGAGSVLGWSSTSRFDSVT